MMVPPDDTAFPQHGFDGPEAKKDAAKLGANGLLLQSLGESGGVIVGSGTTAGSSTSFVGASGGGLIKTVSVVAIYVTEE